MAAPDQDRPTNPSQPGHTAPDRTDPAKGSPAKGAHRFGDQGAGTATPPAATSADPGFATNGE